MRYLVSVFFVLNIFLFAENQINTKDSASTEKNMTIDTEESEFKIIEFQQGLTASSSFNFVYSKENNFKHILFLNISLSNSITIPPEIFILFQLTISLFNH